MRANQGATRPQGITTQEALGQLGLTPLVLALLNKDSIGPVEDAIYKKLASYTHPDLAPDEKKEEAKHLFKKLKDSHEMVTAIIRNPDKLEALLNSSRQSAETSPTGVSPEVIKRFSEQIALLEASNARLKAVFSRFLTGGQEKESGKRFQAYGIRLLGSFEFMVSEQESQRGLMLDEIPKNENRVPMIAKIDVDINKYVTSIKVLNKEQRDRFQHIVGSVLIGVVSPQTYSEIGRGSYDITGTGTRIPRITGPKNEKAKELMLWEVDQSKYFDKLLESLSFDASEGMSLVFQKGADDNKKIFVSSPIGIDSERYKNKQAITYRPVV